MKFKPLRHNASMSECGRYEIRIAHLATGKPFYNAWRLADDKHIDAGYDKAKVKAACAADAEKAA